MRKAAATRKARKHEKIKEEKPVRKLYRFIPLLCCTALFFGCSGTKTDGEKSPELRSYSITAENEGSETSQFVKADLFFDRPVVLQSNAAESLHITIAGNRVKEKDTALEQEQEASSHVILRLHVTAVTNGKLRVEAEKGMKEITDQKEKYQAKPFTLEALIPTGIELQTVEEKQGTEGEAAWVKKRVSGSFKIRSILWLKLTKNGVPVVSQQSDSLETLDGAVAVHGHDFLSFDEAGVVQDIADALSSHFGEAYSFQAAGDTITVIQKDAEEGVTLDLQVYEYKRMNGKDLEETGAEGKDENDGK
jgi:hypothetical protein